MILSLINCVTWASTNFVTWGQLPNIFGTQFPYWRVTYWKTGELNSAPEALANSSSRFPKERDEVIPEVWDSVLISPQTFGPFQSFSSMYSGGRSVNNQWLDCKLPRSGSLLLVQNEQHLNPKAGITEQWGGVWCSPRVRRPKWRFGSAAYHLCHPGQITQPYRVHHFLCTRTILIRVLPTTQGGHIK